MIADWRPSRSRDSDLLPQTSMRAMRLKAPAIYTPFASGAYEVKPGLFPLGHDFGNGEADRKAFQIDDLHNRYRQQKRLVRKTAYDEHVVGQRIPPQTETAVIAEIVRRLTTEHPEFFQLDDERRLTCRISGDQLAFDADWRLDPNRTRSTIAPQIRDALDAIACQVQEDIVVLCRDRQRDWLGSLHVCFPSGWAPLQAAERDFAAIHEIIPGAATIVRHHRKHVDLMVAATKGFVRFVWGLQTGAELNQHPRRGHRFEFDPQQPSGAVRVERQTILGFPDADAALFLIRLYLIDFAQIKRMDAWRIPLCAALRGMSTESRRYKGIEATADKFVAWLEQ